MAISNDSSVEPDLLESTNKMLDTIPQMLSGFNMIRNGLSGSVLPCLDMLETQLTQGGGPENPFTLFDWVSAGMSGTQRAYATTTMSSMAYMLVAAEAELQGTYQSIGDGTSPGTLANTALYMQSGLNQIKGGIGDATTANTLLFGMTQCAANADAMLVDTIDALDSMAVITGGLSAEFDSDDIPAMLEAASAVTDHIYQLKSNAESTIGIVDELAWGLNAMKGGIGDAATENTLLFGSSTMLGLMSNMRDSFFSTVFPNLDWCQSQLSPGNDPENPTTLCDMVTAWMSGPPKDQAMAIISMMTSGLGEAESISQQIYQGIGDGSQENTLTFAATSIQDELLTMKNIIGSTDPGDDETLLGGLDNCKYGEYGNSGLNGLLGGIGSTDPGNTLLYGMVVVTAGLEGLCGTPAGSGVQVNPAADVSLSFTEVTSEGETTAIVQPDPPDASNFTLLAASYDISTTATFTGTITVAVDYDDSGLTPEQEEALSLWHYENCWVDVTTRPVDTVNNVITGVVDSLSPFVVGLLEEEEEGGTISGTVTDAATLQPIASVNIGVYDLSYNFIRDAYTDEYGHYEVAELPAGNYKLCFTNWGGRYVTEWHHDASSFEEATEVTVTEGSTTTVDEDLVLGGTISGTITDSVSL